MSKKCAILIMGIFLSRQISADVTSDGSVGTQVTTGPHFEISHGLQEKTNLFHSFSDFSIGSQESATFTKQGIKTPASIRNILARVTGGKPSDIFGQINSEFGGANLYLMNPHGILFGEKASLNVQGSFHATTADYLRLGKDAFFYAELSKDSHFISAAPAAFGFLSNNPASITIKGENVGEDVDIKVPTGKMLSVIGGDIEIEDRVLYAPSGRINLAAVGSEGEVELTEGNLVVNASQKGEIRISHPAEEYPTVIVDDEPIFLGYNAKGEAVYATYANLDVSNYHGTTDAGQIFIQGGEFFVEGAGIFADVYQNGEDSQEKTNASINIAIDGDITLVDNAVITTNSETQKNSGDITITAKNMTFHQTQEFGDESGSFVDDYLGIISTDRFGPGTAGDINIKLTDSLDLNPGAILSTAQSYNVEGNGGNIHIDAREVTLQNAGMIRVETFGENAGNITIHATEKISLLHTDTVQDIPSGISASTSEESIGEGGNIYLETPNLILDAGKISAFSDGSGNAGSITITAASHVSLTNASGITTEAENAGGGNITFNVRDSLKLFDGSRITAETRGDKSQDTGGNITISNPAIFTLDNSRLLANAYAGNGGRIDINTRQPNVLGDSRIDVSSELGLNGQFRLNSVKLRNELLSPPPKILSTQELWSNRCARMTREKLGRFLVIGRDALPPGPGDPQTSPYVAEDEEYNFFPSFPDFFWQGSPETNEFRTRFALYS